MADRIVQLKDQEGNNIYPIIAGMLYPVGSIYMSVNSTDPSTLFGGTWERIEDTFLLASGTNHAAGLTGGEETHTLTVDEMPSHYHDGKSYYDGYAIGNHGQYNGGTYQTESLTVDFSGTMTGHHIQTANAGGGQAHNNMPPYLAVYVWKRIA